MKKWFGKKQLLVGTLVVALGMAVYLNYYFAESPSGLLDTSGTKQEQSDKHLGEALNVNTAPKNDYFTQARTNREAARAEMAETVKELLSDVKATDEQKAAATAQAVAMTKAIEQENTIESLVKAKGFADCVVYIEDANCSIVVSAESLTVQDTAKISQIVTSQSGILAQNINIVTVNS